MFSQPQQVEGWNSGKRESFRHSQYTILSDISIFFCLNIYISWSKDSWVAVSSCWLDFFSNFHFFLNVYLSFLFSGATTNRDEWRRHRCWCQVLISFLPFSSSQHSALISISKASIKWCASYICRRLSYYFLIFLYSSSLLVTPAEQPCTMFQWSVQTSKESSRSTRQKLTIISLFFVFIFF